MTQQFREMYRNTFVSNLRAQLAAVDALRKRLEQEDGIGQESWRQMTNDLSKAFLQGFGSFLRENPFLAASSETLETYAVMLEAGIQSLEGSHE